MIEAVIAKRDRKDNILVLLTNSDVEHRDLYWLDSKYKDIILYDRKTWEDPKLARHRGLKPI